MASPKTHQSQTVLKVAQLFENHPRSLWFDLDVVTRYVSAKSPSCICKTGNTKHTRLSDIKILEKFGSQFIHEGYSMTSDV